MKQHVYSAACSFNSCMEQSHSVQRSNCWGTTLQQDNPSCYESPALWALKLLKTETVLPILCLWAASLARHIDYYQLCDMSLDKSMIIDSHQQNTDSAMCIWASETEGVGWQIRWGERGVQGEQNTRSESHTVPNLKCLANKVAWGRTGRREQIYWPQWSYL